MNTFSVKVEKLAGTLNIYDLNLKGMKYKILQNQAWVLLFFSFSLISCSKSLHQSRIILLPDTQYYAEKYPEILDSQINWIVENAKEYDFVIQQGDLTQNNNDEEWETVQKAFNKLNNVIPYVLAVGNHDMGSTAGKFADVRNTEKFNQYFSFEKMSAMPGFGGFFENGKTDNAYYFFQKGKFKWLVLTLEFGPRNEVLHWANDIVDRYRDRTIILNTHSYMYSDSTRQGPGDSWRPQAYGIGKDSLNQQVNDGEQIWEKLVKKHSNIRFVFSGHVLNSGVGTLVSINDAGYLVYQMLANYQDGVKGAVKGGNGWLRILNMDIKKKTLSVKTFSPYINQFKEEPAHQFLIKNVVYETGN